MAGNLILWFEFWKHISEKKVLPTILGGCISPVQNFSTHFVNFWACGESMFTNFNLFSASEIVGCSLPLPFARNVCHKLSCSNGLPNVLIFCTFLVIYVLTSTVKQNWKQVQTSLLFPFPLNSPTVLSSSANTANPHRNFKRHRFKVDQHRRGEMEIN